MSSLSDLSMEQGEPLACSRDMDSSLGGDLSQSNQSMEISEETPTTPTPSTSMTSAQSSEDIAVCNKPISLRKKCIFCDKVERMVGKRRRYVIISSSYEVLQNFIHLAEILDDKEMIEKFNLQKKIPYHAICRTMYQNKADKISKSKHKGEWHLLREIHRESFSSLVEFINREIVQNEKIYFLSTIYNRYKAIFDEICFIKKIDNCFGDYTPQNLQEKIINEYNEVLAITSSSAPHNKKIVHKKNLEMDKVLTDFVESEENKVQNVAYNVRNSINAIKPNKLPAKITVDDIIKGECEVPEKLFNFMCDLIQGPDYRRRNSDDDLVKIKSICQDIIYCTTKGRIKPSKHLMLGLAVKSMTNSRKLLTMLNNYGSTVSYNIAEELETEMTTIACENENILPSSITANNTLCTNVAFDNYDRFVDTINGKDTLHDTVGIVYQFPASNTSEIARPSTSVENEEHLTNRRRRRFDFFGRDIPPYPKKPVAETTLLSLNDILEMIRGCRVSKESAVIKDIVWSLCFSLLPSTPMWLGFHSKLSIDNSEKQIVDYLPPLNHSPTKYSVVYETMVISQKIATQCNQPRIIVTYDLAIAKMAMQIQLTECPKFDNLFINLGAFHIQMAFFKAIGSYIDSCGITDILVDAQVLAAGSVNGFISSKHFNRCKRIHPLLSVALQSLLLETFISSNELEPSLIIDNLTEILSNKVECTNPLNLSTTLQDIVRKYQDYLEKISAGEYGKTAQFYLQYIELVNLYFRFSRSIRTNDFDLYIDSLYSMANWFFVFNQQNYCRWIIMYCCNLMKLKMTDSPLYHEFLKGAFSIKRTSNTLSRSPVDLTLEQTINADAASSLTGVTHFSTSIGARQRWALSHSMRTKIISKILQEINLTANDDSVRELEHSRWKKDREAAESIMSKIKQYINPFDSSINKKNLFNIATGRSVSDNVSKFLLEANDIGENRKIAFISECNIDCKRFESPIPRIKISNFSSECIKKSIKSSDGNKQTIIRMERNIFGRLLALALNHKISIETCLSYPLAPAPLSLFQCTGEMNKTDKSVLAKKIKKFIDPEFPSHIDIEIIDGFYFLHKLGPAIPQTFGRVAEFILRKICNSPASEIHIIFDRYVIPSIKDAERTNRDEIDIPYSISGPSQSRPNDFLKSLRNKKFKEALISFLGKHWENSDMAFLIGDKKIYLTVGINCYSYIAVENKVIKTEESQLQCTHEEADTRIIFHISKCPDNSKILVKSSDTDVLVILLGHIFELRQFEIWLMSSTNREVDDNCVNCTKLGNILGENMCKALPGFHAYTGCDFTASFYKKGKSRPFEILKSNEKYQIMFAELNSPNDIENEEKIATLQQFTCQMYGIQECVDVNLARVLLFEKHFSSFSIQEKFWNSVCQYDSGSIPPCWQALKQKILRTIYVNALWQNARKKHCITLALEECGWIYDEDNVLITPNMFDGSPTPIQVNDVLVNENENEYSENCSEDNDDDIEINDDIDIDCLNVSLHCNDED